MKKEKTADCDAFNNDAWKKGTVITSDVMIPSEVYGQSLSSAASYSF